MILMLLIVLLIYCTGCINRDPFHVTTHYPTWVYEQYNREDAAWIEYCQTNNL